MSYTSSTLPPGEHLSRACAGCGEPATDICSGCYLVRYCSRDCQVSHRKAHKAACRSSTIPGGAKVSHIISDTAEGTAIAITKGERYEGTYATTKGRLGTVAGGAEHPAGVTIAVPPFSFVPDYVAACANLPDANRRRATALLKRARAGTLTAEQLDDAQSLAGHGVVLAMAADHEGVSLLHIAAERDDADLARALLDRVGLQAAAAWSLDVPSPVHVAALCGSVRTLRVILDAASAGGGAAIARDLASLQCFWMGGVREEASEPPGAILPLAQVKARVGEREARAREGRGAPALWRPLHWAASAANASAAAAAVALLLGAGAPPEHVEHVGGHVSKAFSPLCMAGMLGNVEAFKALIAAGADVRTGRGYYHMHAVVSPVTFTFEPPASTPTILKSTVSETHFYNIGGGMHRYRPTLRSPTPAEAKAMMLAAIEAGADFVTPPPRTPGVPLHDSAGPASAFLRCSARGGVWKDIVKELVLACAAKAEGGLRAVQAAIAKLERTI